MAALAAVSLTLFVSAAFGGQPGSVDSTFNPGRGPLSVGPGEAKTVLVRADGKILVGGFFNGVGLRDVAPLLRLEADGRLDESFNASEAKERFPAAAGIAALALQSDGKVIAGPVFNRHEGHAETLVRLNEDGSIDPAFNPQLEGNNGAIRITRAVVQPDGRILVSGSFASVNGVARRNLARLHADGSLDQTFSPVRTGSFALLPNGQLIVASDTFYRLHNDGSLDPSFNAQMAPGESGYSGIGPFLLQADGKIVYTQRLDFYGTDAVRRLNANGSIDPVFKVAYGQFVFLSLIQTDGKIVAGSRRLLPDGTHDETFKARDLDFSAMGQQSDGKLLSVGRFYTAPYGIRRILNDGSIDSTFAVDAGGLMGIGRAKIERAALLPDGRIAVGGPFTHFNDVPRRGLALLHHDGTVDESFDAGELVTLQYIVGNSTIRGLVAQPDGKLLVTHSGGLVRLNPDGSVETTFMETSERPYYGAILQPDGKVLVYGQNGLVRLFSDGSRDPSFNAALPEGWLLLLEPDGKMIVGSSQRIATRLHPDGSIDDSFPHVGGVPTYDRVHAIAPQPDDAYLVSRSDIGSTKSNVFFRLLNDGRRDPSFSSDVATVQHIILDAAGITVAGDVSQWKVWQTGGGIPGITRLNFDGSRDPSFQTTQFDGTAFATELLRQPDGNLIVVGDFGEVNGIVRRGIARLIGNSPNHLGNISTRVRVGAGQAAAIGGFIVVGDAPKRVVVRALGPSLAASGLPTAELLADPAVELLDSTGAVVASNNDWREAEADINATGIAPREHSESAIVATLAPGAYTAVVRDARGGSGGIGLVEIYDLNPGNGSALANISTRGRVEDGENVMIGGFILRGSESTTVVARASGPSLAGAGVADILADPSLSVYDSFGEVVAANDNWRSSQQATLEALQMGSASDKEAALIVTLPPGAYTAIVRGEGGHTGVGLVEIYDVP